MWVEEGTMIFTAYSAATNKALGMRRPVKGRKKTAAFAVVLSEKGYEKRCDGESMSRTEHNKTTQRKPE